jgi:hypothetical protein
VAGSKDPFAGLNDDDQGHAVRYAKVAFRFHDSTFPSVPRDADQRTTDDVSVNQCIGQRE